MKNKLKLQILKLVARVMIPAYQPKESDCLDMQDLRSILNAKTFDELHLHCTGAVIEGAS